ncbi:MAG TPA: abortive infection family protein [Deltaproteobacteria bacterium]|nr:abortive infection family protein [Deltaproteobacteria bacterium]
MGYSKLLMTERGQQILMLAKAIQSTFSTSEWTEIGYITSTDEWVDRHPRLLRSLRWGDDDYKGHVLDAVKYILNRDPENLRKLFEYDPISNWLKRNEQGFYDELFAEIFEMEVPLVIPSTSTDSGFAALADAQALLRGRGPTSAVDRVHTGLHAFLKAVCDRASIKYSSDPTANQLLKLLLEQHPSLRNLGPRSEDIRKMIRTSASIIDAMGTLRNNASLAHPNEELLGHDEALFVINLARSLIRFLDAKL